MPHTSREAGPPPASAGPRSAAFFDVDGTLTATTTMFDFLEYHLRLNGRHDEYFRLRQRLREMTSAGASRTETNREYYRIYAGEAAGDLRAEGAEWFAQQSRAEGFFRPGATAAFRCRGAAGHLMVLVSGSFAPCLAPLADFLGADIVLSSQPEIRVGRYTGAIESPMIGAAKAAAARDLAATWGISLRDSSAFSDHLSDQPLLDLAGEAFAVGEDEHLARAAAERGWRRLDAPPLPTCAAPRCGGHELHCGHRQPDRRQA